MQSRVSFASSLRAALRLSDDERTFLAAAWLLALPADLALRTAGFRRTARFVAKTPAVGLAPLSVAQAERLVQAAFRRSLAKDSCLPRSIVQFALQRAAGSDVALVIGVRREGSVGADVFAGHAWVQDRGAAPRDPDHAVIFELFGA